MPFRVLTTSAFEREARKLVARQAALSSTLQTLIEILEVDPHNHTGKYRIKKLAGVKTGEGEWRIRAGNYRLRYDIHKQDVVLHSFRDRKDAYK